MQPERHTSSTTESVIAGIAGAVTLTAVHQVAQRLYDGAPRMDVVGMRAMKALRQRAAVPVPGRDTLYRQTLAGDLVSNALYYSLVGVGSAETRWARGAALGLAAGFGALVLPRPMGLGDPPHSERTANQVLTVAWYTVGGFAAAAMLGLLVPDGNGRGRAQRPDV